VPLQVALLVPSLRSAAKGTRWPGSRCARASRHVAGMVEERNGKLFAKRDLRGSETTAPTVTLPDVTCQSLRSLAAFCR
jgi:hypothetical protein